MSVEAALAARRSVRAFLPDPVDGALLRKLLALAARAPSGGNLQPWHLYVLAGAPLADFRARIAARIDEPAGDEQPEYDIYPRERVAPYSDRTFAVGEALYRQIGIERGDKLARRAQFARNFDFFGAPVGLFCYVHRKLGPPQWSDLGMYLQSLMLLLAEHGLASCPQECWAMYPKTVSTWLGAPDDLMLFTGMAIGYADPSAPINALQTERVELEGFAEIRGLS